MKSIFLLFVLSVSFSFFGTSQITDIQQLKNNLINDALENQGYKPRIERYITSDYSKTKTYLKQQNNAGGWNDVDYADRDNDWNPLHHLDRVLVMTYNFSKKSSEWYKNPKLLKGITRAMEYWYTVNPECDNWYKNQIAKQFYLNVIALLLEKEIDESLLKKMVNDLTENPTMTGSNRTLLATSTFYRGILENNPEKIKLGVSGVTDQIEISTKEGVQPDFSFHQHGHFIYNGSYGFNFLRESIWLATIVHGTQFAFSENHIKVLRDYYLNGTRWMIRGPLIDYNVRGRQVGRGDAMWLYGNLLIPILEHLIIADPEFAQEYKRSIENIVNWSPQDISGNKHFWRSDYSIHHQKNYSSSLKMCSERTVGIELNMNSENKLGYWLPYGLHYIYRKGNEYNGIFPVWNWAHLPGVTNPDILIEEKEKGKAHTQQTSFVGGVTNGKNGISVMDFQKNETRAKKAWFWFDDEIVALGAGISSTHDSAIFTTLNQTLLRGIVDFNQNDSIGIFEKGKTSLIHPKWVLHDSVAYVFPEPHKVELSAEIQKGNLQQIYGLGKDTVFSTPVFSLWMNHGIKPQNASYQYIVIPGTSQSATNNFVKNSPVWVLLNQAEIQAVYQKNLELFGIVFHQKGQFEYENLQLIVDEPCLILYDEKSAAFSISDPTTKLSEVNVQINKNGNSLFNKTVRLPENGFAGSSVQINF